MIVRDQTTVKKYVSVNASVTYETLEPFIRQVERKYIKPLIGKAQYAIFDTDTEPSEALVKEAWELAQETICYFAFYEALPDLSVQITEAGIFTASSDETQIASDKHIKELQRSKKRLAHETLDEMLKVMESDTSKFAAWTADASYTSHKSLLVNSTAIFNKYYNIFDSRQTFVALKPELITVEKQYIEAPVQADLLEALKTISATNTNRTKAKTLLQQAIVAFTIAKVMSNGMFVLDAQGIHVRFDVLPYEKVNTNVNLKINDFLVHTRKNKIAEAEQYLKQAVELIKANPTDFAEYVPVEEAPIKKTVYQTKSTTLL